MSDRPAGVRGAEGPATWENRFRDWFRSRRQGPLIVAHRGDSSHAPENTLEAGRCGHEAGAEAWEIDVQLSRDGVPVVIHDESLLRTTDVARRFAADPRAASGFFVSDFDLEEILMLDAGAWFLEPGGGPRSAAGFGTIARLDAEVRERCASGAIRIPTLDEALRLTSRLDWMVNVELKSFPNTNPAVLDAVLSDIDTTETADRVLISSFDHADIARAAHLRPDIATGVLAATPLARPEAYVRELVGADFFHPSTAVLGADADAYRRRPSPWALRASDLMALRERGIPVLVYTVNDARRGGLAAHLVEAGVAGLFGDDPGRLRALFG